MPSFTSEMNGRKADPIKLPMLRSGSSLFSAHSRSATASLLPWCTVHDPSRTANLASPRSARHDSRKSRRSVFALRFSCSASAAGFAFVLTQVTKAFCLFASDAMDRQRPNAFHKRSSQSEQNPLGTPQSSARRIKRTTWTLIIPLTHSLTLP